LHEVKLPVWYDWQLDFFAQKVLYAVEEVSRKAQRRKGAAAFLKVFFASLRETYSLPRDTRMRLRRQRASPIIAKLAQ
jgi:hypothetical protein